MKKWYLQTWFIAIMFSFSIFIIPFIIGVILLILQYMELRKLNASYGTYDELQSKISALRTEFSESEMSLQSSYDKKVTILNDQISNLKKQKEEISNELSNLEADALIAHYDFSDYDGLTSEECKNKLALIKQQEKDFLKSGDALHITSDGTKKEIMIIVSKY